MKTWNVPEIQELNFSNTEGFTLVKTTQDGTWTSKDGKITIPTYSDGKIYF